MSTKMNLTLSSILSRLNTTVNFLSERLQLLILHASSYSQQHILCHHRNQLKYQVISFRATPYWYPVNFQEIKAAKWNVYQTTTIWITPMDIFYFLNKIYLTNTLYVSQKKNMKLPFLKCINASTLTFGLIFNSFS